MDGGLLLWWGLCSPSQHSDFRPRRQGSREPGLGPSPRTPWGPALGPSSSQPASVPLSGAPVFVPHTVSPPLDILVLGEAFRGHKNHPVSSASFPFTDGNTEVPSGAGEAGLSEVPELVPSGGGHQACFLDDHTASSLHPPGPVSGATDHWSHPCRTQVGVVPSGSIWWVQMPPSPEMSAFGTEHRITQSTTLGLPPETCLFRGGSLHTPATLPACAGPAFIPRLRVTLRLGAQQGCVQAGSHFGSRPEPLSLVLLRGAVSPFQGALT